MNYTVSGIVSDETLSRIIDIESAGNPNAKARTSSATGLAQFINSTWLSMVELHRPDLLEGRTEAQVLALRTEPAIAIELLARLTEDNARGLSRGYTDGDLYLAHFAGVATARKVLEAKPTASTATVFSPKQIAANRSILEGKTCGEVRAWAARKMAKARTDWLQIHRPAPPADQLNEQAVQTEPEAEPDALKPVESENKAPPVTIRSPGPWQRLKRWLGWGTGAAGGGGVLTYFTSIEFLIVAAVTIVVAILIGFAIALWLFGKARVASFVSRLARKVVPE